MVCPGILSLRLRTRKLAKLREFYVEGLGLRLSSAGSGSITFAAGGTEIEFVAVDEGEPFYHIALNIPENKLGAAKRWVTPIAPLLKGPAGSDEYDFRSWNAQSVYFNDPAGNILELIARHDLPNSRDGEFTVADILYASEIGIVVDDVPAYVAAVEENLGLLPFRGSVSGEFAALGDDHRLLIVSKRGRAWLGGDAAAQVFAMDAVLCGDRAAKMPSMGLPYEIQLSVR